MEPLQDSVGTASTKSHPSPKTQEYQIQSGKQTDNVGIKDNLFELVLTNDKGYGLFAVENIPRGTCILVESPLMTTPLKPGGKGLLGMNIAGLVSKLKSLSREQHETFFALYHNPNFIPGVKKRLRRELQEQKLNAPIKLPDVCDPMTLVKLAAIYGSNMLKLGDDRELGTEVFPLHSRINYSCVPNLQAHYNPTTQKLIVHAVRYINKGEELLTRFHTNSCRTHEQRDAEFKARCFTCECRVCTGDDAAESNERRKSMLRLDLSLEAYDKSNKPRNTFEVARNAGVALEIAQELLELFKKEGILDCELQVLYRRCSKYSLQCGLFDQAVKFAKKERDIERYCIGTETAHLEKDMKGAEFWLKHVLDARNKAQVQRRASEEWLKGVMAFEGKANGAGKGKKK